MKMRIEVVGEMMQVTMQSDDGHKRVFVMDNAKITHESVGDIGVIELAGNERRDRGYRSVRRHFHRKK